MLKFSVFRNKDLGLRKTDNQGTLCLYLLRDRGLQLCPAFLFSPSLPSLTHKSLLSLAFATSSKINKIQGKHKSCVFPHTFCAQMFFALDFAKG